MTPNRQPSRWPRAGRTLVVAAVAGAVAVGTVAFALWPDERGTDLTLSDLVGDADPGPIHVHGLGVNPADRSLLIATHTGLYRVGADEEKAKLIGQNRQDTMGFTVAGRNRFLGSGHPDPNTARERSLPPLLGLIESRDAGHSWRTISLSGSADFHVLRFAGDRVYGYDASHDRLLVSANRGRSWRSLNHPGPLIDLVVDPRDPRRLLATTQTGLFSSINNGRVWRPLAAQAGFLAWPSSTRIYLVAGSGQVFAGRRLSGRWAQVGDVGGEPAALLAQTDSRLYVALHDGTIKFSADGGRAWRTRSSP